MADAYDKAVEWLTARPKKIVHVWEFGDHPSGILFRYATPDGLECISNDVCYGCLVMIANEDEPLVAWTSDLTAAIRADKRIPRSPLAITPANLPVFAEWQRRLDRDLNRAAPVWAGPEVAAL